jgi:hypothetical protein
MRVVSISEHGENEKQEFLGNAAALLFPIDWPEPFGLVLIEAMACGTPVIAYPFGSVPELIDDGETGFLVKDIGEAMSAVHRIEEIDRVKCRQVFDNRFTAARMASDYVELYERLTRGEPVQVLHFHDESQLPSVDRPIFEFPGRRLSRSSSGNLGAPVASENRWSPREMARSIP